MGHERTGSLPQVGDRLVREQGDAGRDERRRGCELPPRAPVRPREEPETDGRRGVEGHDEAAERRRRVLEPIAGRDAAVDRMEQRPVDDRTLLARSLPRGYGDYRSSGCRCGTA